MTRVTALACMLLSTATGCSLLYSSDSKLFQPHDSGLTDTGTDSGVDSGMDGSMDSGMDADAGPPPEDCTKTGDEDMDGLADCDDFDCNGYVACCGSAENRLTENWSGSLTSQWGREPMSVSTSLPLTSDGKLTNFNNGEDITGIIASCQPLALGAQFKVTFQALGRCMGMEPTAAECSASVVLTGAEHMAIGHGFLDDFAIRMNARGEMSATSAGEVLATASFEPNQRIAVTLTIAAALDSRGRPSLQATVETNVVATGAEATLLEPTIFIRQQSLQHRGGGCGSVGGLRVGVEGIGDGVLLEPLTVDSLGCANPSLFSPPDFGTETLGGLNLTTPGMDGFSVPMDGGVAGGLGAPTLTHIAAASSNTWQVYAELTNLDPALERFTRVTWAVGFSQRAAGAGVDWRAGPSFPLLGTNPPGCLMVDGPCAPGQPSYREPYVQWLDSDVRSETAVFYAYEPGPAMGHEIWVGTRLDADAPVTGQTALLAPGAMASGGAGMHLDEDCTDLRDPAAFSVRDRLGVVQSNWLLYTCASNGVPPEIHALRLRASGGSIFPGATPVFVLTPSTLGAFAAAGVWGAEPVVDTGSDGEPLLRLWFMGRSVGGLATVGLALGSLKPDYSELPTLAPYAANPVLRPTASALGACADGCTLSDLAVTRADAQTLIFLFAKRDGDAYSLVPLSQPWAATTPSVP